MCLSRTSWFDSNNDTNPVSFDSGFFVSKNFPYIYHINFKHD